MKTFAILVDGKLLKEFNCIRDLDKFIANDLPQYLENIVVDVANIVVTENEYSNEVVSVDPYLEELFLKRSKTIKKLNYFNNKISND